MAKPRVFISSTYFDLRVLRADLDRFIAGMGYEPVLFEKGHVTYQKENALEEDCYKEVQGCDILIAIIGNKYGSQSKDQKHSITQRELKAAIDLKKQVYVFVQRSVLSEYPTYQANKTVKGFTATSVDNVKVFGILDEVYALPVGNPVEPFEVSDDITAFLREQWAGLFQGFLQQAERQKEISTIRDLEETASTLRQLVTYLTEERSKGDEAIKDILLSAHPAFSAAKSLLKVNYRVSFHSLKELEEWLLARGYLRDDTEAKAGFIDFDSNAKKQGIRFSKSLFDADGKLKIISPENWKNKWIETYPIDPPASSDDEIPF